MNLSKTIKNILDIVWPILNDFTDAEKEEMKVSLENDNNIIKSTNWLTETDVALEEARRLNDAEMDRRKNAETKAGVYLAAVTALSPVLVSLLTGLWDDKSPLLLNIVSTILFVLAVIYLFYAGIWAFRTLKISSFHRVDVINLSTSWKKKKPSAALVKQLLQVVRFNREGVNKKVTCIIMTHEFLLRSFLCFIFLLIIKVSTGGVIKSIESPKDINYNIFPENYVYLKTTMVQIRWARYYFPAFIDVS